MKFAVTVIRPTGYQHSDCFAEIAQTLMYGLRSLGYEAEVKENELERDGTSIILGAHLLTPKSKFTNDVIIYNLEQLGGPCDASEWCWMTQYKLWDYSPLNANGWKALGANVEIVPIGYVPELRRISHDVKQDIDVLFYGSANMRRLHIINGLKKRGLRANSAFGLYGKFRDLAIAQAKLVLNVHYYDAKVFEIVRVSYLLANGWPVVSESSPDEDADLAGGYVSVSYDRLIDACVDLIADDERRKALGEAGFEKFSKRSEADILKVALA